MCTTFIITRVVQVTFICSYLMYHKDTCKALAAASENTMGSHVDTNFCG